MGAEVDEFLSAGDAALKAGLTEPALEHFRGAYQLAVRALAASGPLTIDAARRDLLRCQDGLMRCLETRGELGAAAHAADAALDLSTVLREPEIDTARRRATRNALYARLGYDVPNDAPIAQPADAGIPDLPSHFRIVRVDIPMRYDVKIDGVAVSDDMMPGTLIELAERVPPVALHLVVQGGRLAIGATAVVVEAARDAALNRITLSLAETSAESGRAHLIHVSEEERVVPALVAADRALQAGATRVVIVFG